MSDQVLARAVVDISAQGIDAVDQEIHRVEQSLRDLQHQLQNHEIEISKFDAATDAQIARLDLLRKAQDRATTSAKASATAAEIQGSALRKGSMNVGQAALDASRGLEDLQYGFAGVVNNIPQLVMSLGGTAGLTAAISLLAIGANQLLKHWGDLASLFERSVPFPKVAGDVKGLKAELEKAQEEMKKLGDRTTVTLSQLERFNQLRARTAELEKRIADEEERQQRVKKFGELKDTDKTAEEKQRADDLSPSFGDPENKAFERAVQGAMPRDRKAKLEKLYKEALQTEQRNLNNDPLNLVGIQGQLAEDAEKLARQIRADEEQIRKEATQLVADAVIGGKLPAFRKVEDLMKGRPELFTDAQRQAFEAASPEGQQRRKDMEAKMAPRPEDAGQPAGGDGGGGAGAGGGNHKVAEPKPGKIAPGSGTGDGGIAFVPQPDHAPPWTGRAGAGRMGKQPTKGRDRVRLSHLERLQALKDAKIDKAIRRTLRNANAELPFREGAHEATAGPELDDEQRFHPQFPWQQIRHKELQPGGFHPRASGPPKPRGQDAAALAALTGRGLGAHATTQMVVAQTQGQLMALMRRLESVEATNRQLTTNARTFSRTGLKR